MKPTGWQIPAVPGIRVASRAAAQTDSAGFSVIPQLSHYHQNVIRIDPETLPDNADADDPVVQVIPSKERWCRFVLQ